MKCQTGQINEATSPEAGPPPCAALPLGPAIDAWSIIDGQITSGVPLSYETTPPWDPTVSSCLGPYGGPRRGELFLMSEVPLYRVVWSDLLEVEFESIRKMLV